MHHRALTLLLLALLATAAMCQRTSLEVYNCVKKAVAKPAGSCRADLQQCYSNPDCSVDFDTSGCLVKPTGEAFVSCRKWAYRTPEGKLFGECLDQLCKIF